MNNINELLERAKSGEKTLIAVACCEDSHVLDAAVQARESGICGFILVGDIAAAERIAQAEGLDLSGFDKIDVKDKAEACYAAAKLASEGAAGGIMKGLVDTSVILKAVLAKELGLRTDRRLTHLAAFSVPSYHKMLFITDAAINIAPDLDGFTDIIKNAVGAVRALGVEKPKVALLAAKEKADPKMPVTMIYQDLLEQRPELLDDAFIAGPLALDNAVSRESAVTKGIHNDVAGDADILVCPDIEAGNVLYKSLSFLNTTESGGMVLGSRVPVVLTSRADSARSKLISIALAVCNSKIK